MWRAENFENAPLQNQVFGFEVKLQGGNAMYLQNINEMKKTFGQGGLAKFQKYVFKQPGLVV